jgi:hypothetical protein
MSFILNRKKSKDKKNYDEISVLELYDKTRNENIANYLMIEDVLNESDLSLNNILNSDLLNERTLKVNISNYGAHKANNEVSNSKKNNKLSCVEKSKIISSLIILYKEKCYEVEKLKSDVQHFKLSQTVN